MNYTTKAFLVLLSFVIVFTSCKEETEVPDPQAPEIPELSSFLMKFDAFEEESPRMMDTTRHNWGHAVVNVAVWNTIITVGLAVPVAAFAESFNHQATWNPNDNYWSWTYNFPAQGVVHQAELRASLGTNNSINWEMLISKQGAFTDFVWFTGTSQSGNTGGNWTLFDNPNNPNELLDITWSRTSSTVANIRYTNIIPNDPENGSSIYYDENEHTNYNRNYDIEMLGQGNLTQIEWNHTTLEGRVSNPQHFGDSEWRCWDDQQFDVVCN